MKKPRFMRRVGIALCALVACGAMVVGLLPSQTFADVSTQMTEGDVIAGFVPAGTACESSDPSVAWVDSEGNLKAMKAGKATVSDG